MVSVEEAQADGEEQAEVEATLVVAMIIMAVMLVEADHLYQVTQQMLEHHLVLGLRREGIIVGIAD